MSGPNKPPAYRKRSFRLVLTRSQKPACTDNDDKKAQGHHTGTRFIILKLRPKLGLIASLAFLTIFSFRGDDKNKICGRKIGVDLANPDSWPTPNTPFYAYDSTNSEEVVVLKKDSLFGGYGQSINGFMHALDVAYDKKCPVYITHDADWIWDAFLPIVFGGNPHDMVEEDWELMGKILGVSVVSPNAILSGKTPHVIGSQGGFYTRGATLDKLTIRNRRDTIYRNLFLHSGYKPKPVPNKWVKPTFVDVCSFVTTAAEEQKTRLSNAKYSVLDPTFSYLWLAKLEESTFRDHHPAALMSPEYVKDILQQLNLLEKPIYITSDDTSKEEMQKLRNDDVLKKVIKDLPAKPITEMDGREIHLAVMADAYLGDPASHKSLIIAKMRYALGRGNTFVFTKKSAEGHWVDALENEYVELYDNGKMGLWMG